MDNEIISSKFKNADSLYIKLIYKERYFFGHFVGRIDTKVKDGYFTYRNVTNSEILKSEYFIGINDNIIDYFIDFETKSKKEKPICYGREGDHCYIIELTINGIKTEFTYKLTKENNWNGLVILIKKLKRLKKN
ncbi:hypothetical protein U6A24_09760 [Aquimarina gracilis]|uniref:Uncharacterized protein n=2 Tax=Aquimarina gracilis TaxID=874422 RepID=A0ABU5ZUI5_9FLAO|nr:hypothetical protein [Aquimarina gracilis]